MKKRQGNEKMKQMKKIFPDMEAKKRAWLFALRVFFLCALCILPSYELVKSGMAKTVTMEDMETESLQLKDGETFSQTISIGSGTHVKSLAIGVDSVLDNENASIKVTVQREDATYSRSYTQSEIPAKGFLELKEFDLSGTKAEELMKVGDSILDIYAGRQTKKYLVGNVLLLSVFSAIVMSCCMGLPLFLQFKGYMDPALVMFPSSLMMLSGLWITLYREAEVYRNADQYRPLL